MLKDYNIGREAFIYIVYHGFDRDTDRLPLVFIDKSTVNGF